MFEYRKRKRIGAIITISVFLVLTAAFGIGYFLNFNTPESIEESSTKPDPFFKIPDIAKDAELAASLPGTELVTIKTVLHFKTYYPICGHTLEKTVIVPQQAVNMNRTELQNLYSEWEITDFSSVKVTLQREVEGLCPAHFIIGSLDGFVAIYTYNENGEKVLKEKTDISLATLTPEDQSSIESGIIADTEDDLIQKLEGLSN